MSKWLIGIDEAGRGPLAGPVAVGVFIIKKGTKSKVLKECKDSKQCSVEFREYLYKELKNESLNLKSAFSVGFASAKYIDEYGIVKAIKKAMEISLNRLEKKLNLNPKDCEVFLDGSLKAPAKYKNQKTIIKGDSLIPLISAASIVAKVTRDRLVTLKSKLYPGYNLHIHKGYGTLKHRKAIKKHGLSSFHRHSFVSTP